VPIEQKNEVLWATRTSTLILQNLPASLFGFRNKAREIRGQTGRSPNVDVEKLGPVPSVPGFPMTTNIRVATYAVLAEPPWADTTLYQKGKAGHFHE
jgi:hypothetical protein